MASTNPRDWTLPQRKARYTIGLDFGATFSGFAFAASSDEDEVTVKCASPLSPATTRCAALRKRGSCLDCVARPRPLRPRDARMISCLMRSERAMLRSR